MNINTRWLWWWSATPPRPLSICTSPTKCSGWYPYHHSYIEADIIKSFFNHNSYHPSFRTTLSLFDASLMNLFKFKLAASDRHLYYLSSYLFIWNIQNILPLLGNIFWRRKNIVKIRNTCWELVLHRVRKSYS